MPDRTPASPPAGAPAIPPPLSVAAALVAVQGLVLLCLGAAEALHVVGDRVGVGAATSVFFLVYGAGLVGCGLALSRARGWARGPALITQLIALGLAWNVRDAALVALVLAISAVVTLAGTLHPASLAVLMGEPDGDSADD